MNEFAKIAAVIVVSGASLVSAPSEDLPLGRTIERVTCRGNNSQSYALYLPAGYTPDRAWPILYCLDPLARGRVPVELFAEAAEKTGFIIAGSNNSRNGPAGPAREAIFWLVTDTHERLSIDDGKSYAAGFSGGARRALDWGMNGKLAGVVVCGAAFGSRMPEKVPFTVYAAAGVDDFNHHEMYAMSRELARRSVPHRFVEYDGAHAWMPARLALDALEFFTGRVPPLAAEESRETERQAERFNRFMREVQDSDLASKKNLLKAFRKQAEKPEDSPERRVARRVLGGTFIGAIEVARPLMEKKEYRQAAQAWEVAAVAQPEQPGPWYSLGIALSAAGDKKGALKAIEQAVSYGFRDRERIEAEPLLAPLRAEPRFEAALEAMKR